MAAADWWRDFFTGLPVEFWLRVPTAEQTRAEADFLEKALRLPAGARVLDVPCGGGRHALELTARGYRLTGVDLLEDFLKTDRALAAERQAAVTWERRPMDELPWQAEFDGAYCFGNSFGYLDDACNARFLKAVARSLKPGGRFALDTGLTAEGLFPTYQERRWLQVGDILYFSLSRYDPARKPVGNRIHLPPRRQGRHAPGLVPNLAVPGIVRAAGGGGLRRLRGVQLAHPGTVPARLATAAAGGDQKCLTSRTAREVSWRPRHRTRLTST
jgi:SAM-dependent methyltransferase